MVEIYLGLADRLVIEQEERNRTFSLYLPETPEVSTTDIKPNPSVWLRKIDELRRNGNVEISGRETSIVTPSAGSISVFYDNRRIYVSFSQKDEKAPRDPGFRVPRNGFPNKRSEWLTNAHLYRESWEEGIFIFEDENLVLPQDQSYDMIIRKVAELIKTQSGLKLKGERRAKIEFRAGRDRLNVYHKGIPVLRDYAAISWTPETGFNFIKEMAVYTSVDGLRLIDGETFPSGKLIGRDVCVIDLAQLQGKIFGDEITESVHSFKDGKFSKRGRKARFLTDKVPRSFLCQLNYREKPVYPIDWMDESYDFIGNPEVQREFKRYIEEGNNPNKFQWSGLERRLSE